MSPLFVLLSNRNQIIYILVGKKVKAKWLQISSQLSFLKVKPLLWDSSWGPSVICRVFLQKRIVIISKCLTSFTNLWKYNPKIALPLFSPLHGSQGGWHLLSEASSQARGSQHIERPGQSNGQGHWAGSERPPAVLNKYSFLPGFCRS